MLDDSGHVYKQVCAVNGHSTTASQQGCVNGHATSVAAVGETLNNAT